jgi:hypothetical protein
MNTTKDTSGFYRFTGQKLTYAPSAVRAPAYSLLRAQKDTYTYPVHGWHWFASESEAKTHFGITGD